MELCESCLEPIEMQTAVSRNNRLLRRINRILRARIQTNKSYADSLFIALSTGPSAAEKALHEIWEKAELSCDPDDYQKIVVKVVAALATQPGVSALCSSEAAA